MEREGSSGFVDAEGTEATASTTIPATVSMAIGTNAEEIREPRKFAERMKPRKFQENEELYAEKSPNQREFAWEMGADCANGVTGATS